MKKSRRRSNLATSGQPGMVEDHAPYTVRLRAEEAEQLERLRAARGERSGAAMVRRLIREGLAAVGGKSAASA